MIFIYNQHHTGRILPLFILNLLSKPISKSNDFLRVLLILLISNPNTGITNKLSMRVMERKLSDSNFDNIISMSKLKANLK